MANCEVVDTTIKARKTLHAPNAIHGIQDRSFVACTNVSSGHTRALTAHRQYEDEPRISPDGRRVAFLFPHGGDPMGATDVRTIAFDGTQERDATATLDRHASGLAWMPDSSTLLVQAYDRTEGPLYAVAADGSSRRLPLGPVVDAQSISQASVARNGTIVFDGIEANRPDEVYVLGKNARAPRRVSDINGGIARLQLGAVRSIAWEGPDGMREYGVLTFPPNYDRNRKYPLAVRIHGGPNETSLAAFDPFYQYAASRGYVVFAPNYRGSTNEGNAFEHAIFDDPSAGPGRDVMAGIVAAEKSGAIDPKRIGVSGWSYGGQMTSWMISHYTIFKAAVTGAGVHDLVVEHLRYRSRRQASGERAMVERHERRPLAAGGDIGRAEIADDIDSDRAAFAVSPYTANNLGRWQAASPITFFKNIHTPTLILGNVYDVRVPIVESFELFHALRDNHVPVRFFAYPSGGHLPHGPVRLADAYGRWLDWFDRYLR